MLLMHTEVRTVAIGTRNELKRANWQYLALQITQCESWQADTSSPPAPCTAAISRVRVSHAAFYVCLSTVRAVEWNVQQQDYSVKLQQKSSCTIMLDPTVLHSSHLTTRTDVHDTCRCTTTTTNVLTNSQLRHLQHHPR